MELKEELGIGNPPRQGGVAGRRVVVIGGGVSGSLVAKSLQLQADVTLIDPKDYFEIPFASSREMIEPAISERSVIHHKDYLPHGCLVVSKAINVTTSEVLTEDGRSVAYDYLVIATGHDNSIPRTRTQRLAEYQAEYEKIRSAGSILIIGGGPTGVELAAEIAIEFPAKKVTLVHDGSRLLKFIGRNAAGKALDWLRSKNVGVKLRQSVDPNSVSDGSKTYVSSRGETIQADCVFLCTGKPAGSAWLKETMLKDSMDNLGRLKVDEGLRVKGHRNIFAIGDITDVKEIKQGSSALKHALIAAKNLKMMMMSSGQRDGKLAAYNRRSSPTVTVSLGREEAVTEMAFGTAIGVLPGLIKCKDLYVGETRKLLGLNY
nr:apoptosis-inducing factor homolog B [Ipomoea trifida]